MYTRNKLFIELAFLNVYSRLAGPVLQILIWKNLDLMNFLIVNKKCPFHFWSMSDIFLDIREIVLKNKPHLTLFNI